MSENCGKPVTVSEDGSYFIFRKSSSSEYMNLIKFDLDGILKPEGQEDSPTLIKNINIIETIRNEMKSQTNEEMIHFYEVIL